MVRVGVWPLLAAMVIPSLNQGRFIDETLSSIFQQAVPMEVLVLDGGSTDASLSIIKKWEPKLSYWRSSPDRGQAAAINEGVRMGHAPFVCWLNSDDRFAPGGLETLLCSIKTLGEHVPAVYGQVWNQRHPIKKCSRVKVESFDSDRLAIRCFISQPGTLIRRKCWDAVDGLNEELNMALDYDLWWRLYKTFGDLYYIDDFVAISIDHAKTKTNNNRLLHYQEAMKVVKRHYGKLPLKWLLYWPYSIVFKSIINKI